MENALKTERLEFRLSKSEKKEIQRMAKIRKMSMGEYLQYSVTMHIPVKLHDLSDLNCTCIPEQTA